MAAGNSLTITAASHHLLTDAAIFLRRPRPHAQSDPVSALSRAAPPIPQSTITAAQSFAQKSPSIVERASLFSTAVDLDPICAVEPSSHRASSAVTDRSPSHLLTAPVAAADDKAQPRPAPPLCAQPVHAVDAPCPPPAPSSSSLLSETVLVAVKPPVDLSHQVHRRSQPSLTATSSQPPPAPSCSFPGLTKFATMAVTCLLKQKKESKKSIEEKKMKAASYCTG
ncbi:hypothetical protein M0R45_008791 [Rubus argutus]|uniref:Uncharacterized protein n=1 Tax=Rubus argutus TaxID=59490 RepID=A0AAW1Y350_RUBAR